LNFLVATDKESDVSVDWDFLECIYQNRNAVPTKVPEEERKNFKFDSSKYHDAVIMPWYRSQDQPQVSREREREREVCVCVCMCARVCVCVRACACCTKAFFSA